MNISQKYKGLFQPFYSIGLVAISLLWLTIGILKNQETEYFVQSFYGLLINNISALAFFLFWKYSEKIGLKNQLFVNILITFLVFPLLFVLLHNAILFVYAYFTTICCSENVALNTTVWFALNSLLSTRLTPVFDGWTILYVSYWFSTKKELSDKFALVSKGLVVISALYFSVSMLFMFGGQFNA